MVHPTPSPVIRKPSLLRSRRHKSSSSSLSPALQLTLRIAVVLLVTYYELITFYSHAHSCKFNDLPSTSPRSYDASTNSWVDDGRFVGVEPFHALIVADPQLIDMRSYPGRSWLLRWLGVRITDAYAKKAWRFVKRSRGQMGGLDGVVWLGDLLDSAVLTTDVKEHAAYVRRFHSSFPLPSQSAAAFTSYSPPIPSVILPGNHDLGLHLSSPSLASLGRERFVNNFGPLSGEVEWGGWSLVWVDSMALLEEGESGEEARGFVDKLSLKPSKLPRILLSHIPLFRPEGTFCGVERESPRALRQGAGKNYQNELDEATSQWLLTSLAPTLVYSGDDHDACVIDHPIDVVAGSTLSSVRETTVKAFSMAMGVRKPGYHLLSLYPPTTDSAQSGAFTQTNCVLPDQIGIWLNRYLPAFILLTLSLLVPKLVKLWKTSAKRQAATARSNGLPVHTHSRSLSRTLFPSQSGRNDGSDMNAAEDQDSQFPTFPFSPSMGMDQGYHSGLSGDELPTPANGRFRSDSDEEMADIPANRVRRVSRVWAWDARPSPFASMGTALVGGDEPVSLTSRARSTPSLSTRVKGVLRQVGRAIKRSMLRKLLLGWVGNQLGRLMSGTVGEVVQETAKDVYKVVGWGVGWWLVLFWWFGS